MLKRSISVACCACVVIFLGFSIFTHFLKFPKTSDDLKAFVNNLQDNERKDLECFFIYCIEEESAGYTLFCDKAVSLAFFTDTNHLASEHLALMDAEDIQNNQKLTRGWRVWEKYRSSFSENLFEMKRIKSFGDEAVSIILVNKKRFVEVVDENIEFFRAVLGDETSGKSLLTAFLHSQEPLSGLLKMDHGLIGILFGFGRENSLLFNRMLLIGQTIKKRTSLTSEGREEMSKYSKGKSLNDEYNQLKMRLTSFAGAFLTPIKLPAFLADAKSPETHSLFRKYWLQRELILWNLSQDDFLERILMIFWPVELDLIE